MRPEANMISKKESHGRIGEAAVAAKCWMHGIRAWDTGGLRRNFAGSDLLIDTPSLHRKLLVQVKTGYITTPGHVYLTQCTGERDMTDDKFDADFVVFVNLDPRVAAAHEHDGSLDFSHLSFYVVPRDAANRIFKREVKKGYERPLRNGGQRKLTYMAVSVPTSEMDQYRDAWHILKNTPNNAVTDA